MLTRHRFKNIETLRAHQQGPALVAFTKSAAEEDILAEPIVVKVVQGVSGFSI